ncbi:MAG TPA: CPBP family intramembrane glutamic endopeptidase [Micromonosporaceae bacterium]|nr:CPBP family intramembrane glutamic endopeptidase [Micromonosporaceae bacterium]
MRPLIVVGCVLVAVNVTAKVGPRHGMLVVGPVAAFVLIAIARRAGLTYDEMGLSRRRARRGLAWAGAAVTIVAAVYAVAAALPATRPAFSDERYQSSLAAAAVTALVVIPLATVLPEEIAFRGVLWGMLARRLSTAGATAVSSALFGLWHVLPSLRLNEVNPAVAAVVGRGWPATVAAVAGAVLFTAAAGVLLCELRRRSGSVLAPIGAHWAVNGLGVLATAAVAPEG